jgi:hypothetical protein
MSKIIDRLKEPSTHAGIALIAQAFAFFYPQYATILNCLTALFGGGAVALPEGPR